ncbi:outer membrane beta-barrel protein [Pontibacter populi]|uniref:Outer membrane beta-barrel protein n=1 Tax=Pontibacter populi TaxID=890055 RepID=A0ABV1RT15_9BACT
MKKLLATAIFALMGSGAFAQTTQGTIVISGSLGINRNNVKSENLYNPRTTTLTSVSLTPGVGYFINDGLELGASFGLNYSTYKLDSNKESDTYKSKDTNTRFDFSPFIRKYFMLSDKFAFTGTASAGFSIGKHEFEGSTSPITIESSTKGAFAYITPGVYYFPTEKIGLSATFGSLGYSATTWKSEEGSNKEVQSDFGLNLSSSTFGIGFSYYINR